MTDVTVVDAMRPDMPMARPTLPGSVKAAMDRGRKVMMKDVTKRRLCMKFEKGETYWYLDDKDRLQVQATAPYSVTGGKPPHRIRNKYNLIRPIVEDKVSAATQRVPSYDISPSTTDPEDYAAAKLSEKVALYGYDKWRLRDVTMRVVKLAIGGGGEGYVWPYFDPNVGPYAPNPLTGKLEGRGEVEHIVLTGNEVYWAAGMDFLKSPWWCVERARATDDVTATPGYCGPGKLKPDATTSDIPTDRDQADLVMVTEYFERPCPKWPKGRWYTTLADGRVIVDNRLIDDQAADAFQPYPLVDADGEPIDEPILHRLVYTVDPELDRDFGLTWQLIDCERTYQDCWNKAIEWKNRALNPHILAPENSIESRPDEGPGFVRFYKVNPILGALGKPEWEKVDPTGINVLLQMADHMKADMNHMAAFEDIHADANLAAATATAVIQRSMARWQSFLGDLAEFHSRLMRHDLLLVSRFYTVPQLLKVRGRFGPYPIPDFKGADLLSQVDVTVLPGSLEYRTREQITAQVMAYADRKWITPQQAMAAIDGGWAERLIESYQLDVARANRIIQKIRDGSVMDMPTRDGDQIDPQTGAPEQVPTFMPDIQDNVAVWQQVFGDWMKTDEYQDQLDRPRQEVAKLIWQNLQRLQLEQQQREIAAQSAEAESLGRSNAAKPQQAKPLPDQAAATPPDAPAQ